MKNVVITGADRNIGLELTKQFLKRGWKVFAGRYLMELPLLEELQKEYPDTLTLVPLDVSKEETVQAAANMVAEQVDHIDMLIHNAAGFGDHTGGPKAEINFTTFVTPYNINALGAMRLVHYFYPLMQTGMAARSFARYIVKMTIFLFPGCCQKFGLNGPVP